MTTNTTANTTTNTTSNTTTNTGSDTHIQVAIALFPNAFPAFSTVAAALVDIAVLVAVLWFHWAPDALAVS